MLVLTRQKDETIMIGDNVEVTIVDMRGDKVRLGITAPRAVQVHRKEVYDAIRRENRSSSKISANDVPQLGNVTAGGKPAPTADPFLRAAIDEASLGLKEGGLPIGSVLVRGGNIIGRGHNRRVQQGDPMAHAEIDCLKNAGRQKTYRDTVLYSTLMPCFLCSGAVVQFGVPKVVVGESINFKSHPQFMRSHNVEVVDLNDSECIEMMRRFIEEHPELWNEDIGR